MGLCSLTARNEQRQSQQMQWQSEPQIRTLRSRPWVLGLSFPELCPKILSLGGRNKDAMGCHFLCPSEPLSDKQAVL